ncbi:hypothetical protein EJV47_27415 [Hymenobacter gummosus]|uniref:DUF3575 domain-containing protein n=1 Tax=Hymenobacter gummosus TaxID=1776032 RepID=A0A431TUD0_9BACT|nr:hypothetical protein [Hymenobacter gummosus]RTQ44724.1 hypothetical protein EJV47_27415 [Hymenobacter gummosus]
MFSVRKSLGLRLWSGLRHTPVGARAELFRWGRWGPTALGLGYQTNFRGNQQLAARVSYTNPCYGTTDHRTAFQSAELLYSRIHLRPAGFYFSSYTLQGDFGRFRKHQGPALLLGAGYAERRQENTRRPGPGGLLGLSAGLPKLKLHLTATVARWPGAWQWRAEAGRSFRRLDTALQLNSLGRYRELNLSLGYTIY